MLWLGYYLKENLTAYTCAAWVCHYKFHSDAGRIEMYAPFWVLFIHIFIWTWEIGLTKEPCNPEYKHSEKYRPRFLTGSFPSVSVMWVFSLFDASMLDIVRPACYPFSLSLDVWQRNLLFIIHSVGFLCCLHPYLPTIHCSYGVTLSHPGGLSPGT